MVIISLFIIQNENQPKLCTQIKYIDFNKHIILYFSSNKTHGNYANMVCIGHIF